MADRHHLITRLNHREVEVQGHHWHDNSTALHQSGKVKGGRTLMAVNHSHRRLRHQMTTHEGDIG